MASKRCPEAADAVIFHKLPRLEPGPAFLPSRTPCPSSPVPCPASEHPLSYEGSYFACSLQSPEGPEQPPGGWSPSVPAPAPCAALSQPLAPEGPLLGLLLCPPESLGTPSSEGSPGQEQLMARKKLDSPRCPLPVKKPMVGKKGALLLVPKPVYGAPTSFLAPGVSLVLGTQVESPQQHPGNANWALSPVPHPGEPQQRGPCSEHGLSVLSSGLALPLGSPSALPRHCAPFDKCSPFLEASCAPAQSQPQAPEEPWPRFHLPDGSAVSPQSSAMGCPPSLYPLSPHGAGPLYPPTAPTAGEPGALPGFAFLGSSEPFPSAFLQPQTPPSFFPSPLGPYVLRPVDAGPGPVLRDAEPPRDAELPRSTGYPGFAASPGDGSAFQASFGGPEPGSEQHRAPSPRWRVTQRHSSAFQPVCNSEKLSGASGGLQETFAKRGGSWDKARQGQEQPLCRRRRKSRTAPQDTPDAGAGEGNACKAEGAGEELSRPSPPVTPPKRRRKRRNTQALSSSPPMPVIHSVFSLAPYRALLDRAKSPDPLDFCRKNLWEDSPAPSTDGSQEPAALGDAPGASSSGAEQSQGESCDRSVPKEPKPECQELESQEGSPDGLGTEEPSPEDTVLDLSLKKGLLEAGDTQGAVGCAGGTLDPEDKDNKEAAGDKVGLGEGEQPRLPEVDSGDRSSFQSSVSFMFQKYKLLPSTEPPRQESSPQPPTAAPPAPSPPSNPPVPPAGPQPCSVPAPIPVPEVPKGPEEPRVLLVAQVGGVSSRARSSQYFTAVHTWLCDTIAGSVSRSSPELLRQWLEKAEPAEEQGEVPKSLPKPKNGSKAAPNPQKPGNGREIWLAFEDVAVLLANLLSQLETFMSSCPFPHVVRAGAVFIPIHVVKEKLFPKLPGSFVDQVLQKHKVELRPTTLSEERHLRELELKSCTSRMLKLLALKQLPEIYPDLLNLHWHSSIRQQLGSSDEETLNADSKATASERSRKKRH